MVDRDDEYANNAHIRATIRLVKFLGTTREITHPVTISRFPDTGKYWTARREKEEFKAMAARRKEESEW